MMGAVRSVLKLMFILSVLTFIQKRTTNIHAAAICSRPCLLMTNATDIIAIDYKTSAAHSVVSGLKNAVALDVHFRMGYVFWSDVSEQNIKRFGTDGSGTKIIIRSIGVCNGLAVEWRTAQLYWTDATQNTISVSDIEGNKRSVLYSGLDQPRDIALDPDSRLMIWTAWGAKPKIEKASTSGNQRVAIVTSIIQRPNGIEIDIGNKRIFWVDSGTDRVESVDYNGNNRKLISRIKDAFGVALIPPFLFYTASELKGISRNGIWRAFLTIGHFRKMDATTGANVVSSYRVTGRAMGIVAYDNSRQPSVLSPCAQTNGGCSHFCVVKSSGYECVCPTGLTLKQDKRTCEEKMKKFILLTDGAAKSTYIISLDTSDFLAQSLLHHFGTQNPVAVDFDPVEDRVYWSDVAQGAIMSAFSNATSLKILFRCNVQIPDGLAIDKVGRNIYWTDTGTKCIEVARLDGKKRKLLIKDGLDQPRALVLDERNGLMYWTDWGSIPKIERAAMDGSARRSIVTGNLAWPNGLTIDQSTNLLYWADAKLDKIEVSDLNGGNRRIILSSPADIHPFGITVYQGMLYWTDWINKTISLLDLRTGNRELIIRGLQKPMDIHLYDASTTTSGSHPCAVNNGLCSDLCLLKPVREYQCACPTGITLKPDGKNCDYDTFYTMSSDKFLLFSDASTAEIYKVPLAVPELPCIPLGIKSNISAPFIVDYDPTGGKVYWTDVTLKQLARAYLDGSALEVIAQHNLKRPVGMAVDWISSNIYWADAQTNKIEVSRLDGSFRVSLLRNLNLPRAIILDATARKMYWTEGLGGKSKIEQANMDGTARTTLVSTGLAAINSLALDLQKNRLYWCDGKLAKIESVDLHGNNRRVILDLPSGKAIPVGLALFEDALFWTDWKTRSVHKFNMTLSLSKVVIRGLRRPSAVHIYDRKPIASVPTVCSYLNGGCSHICLPNPRSHQCFCPEGVQLKSWDPYTCQGVNRCSSLSAPNHGRLGTCSNVQGQTCKFSCDRGYLLSGSSTRKCNSDGTWTGQQTQCIAVTCPALPAPSNGIRKGCTGTVKGSYNMVCQFHCNRGFNGKGSSSRTCLENGSWSGQDFVCQVITCPPLVIPLKAILLNPSCKRTYGSSCSYSCQTGYTSSTGNVTRTCLKSGQWSGNDINCIDFQPPTFGVTCPQRPLLAYAEQDKFSAAVNWNEPVAIDNSGIAPTVTSNYHPPQTFSEGSHVVLYRAMDQLGNKATCSFEIKIAVINCKSLVVDPEGALRISSCGNHYGSKCNFSCAIGHQLNGSPTVTCVAPSNVPPGVWDKPLPECQAIRCPSLPIPPNGIKIGCLDPLSERYGTICSFSCNVGYNLTGSFRRQCQKNKTWSGIASSCQVFNCTALSPPANVTIFPSSCLSRSTYGQTCSLSCQTAGYVLEGTSERVCGDDGEWTGNNDTLCRDNTPPTFSDTCPRNMIFYVSKCSSSALVSWNEPIATDNSGHVITNYPAVRPPANLSIGLYDVHYSAADGEGNRINCIFNVKVAKKSCPVLYSPRYGNITSFTCGSLFGSQASISCNKGYRLVGSRVRSCEEDGRWSGNLTSCKVMKCPPIRAPSHGIVFPGQCRTPLGVDYKTECFFVCNVTEGYRLEGLRNVSCLENGSWSSDVSKDICKDIQVPSIQCPSNMEVPTTAGKSYATVTWQVPVPTDNSNEPLNISGLVPPQKLDVGVTNIRYVVRDSAGLSRSCMFSIDVKDLEPPKIEPCPGDIKIISTARWHKLLLPEVTVTDNVGVKLFTTNIQNGSEITWGKHNVTYTVSDKAGNKAYCRFLITIADSPCEDLPAPKNGAKACETWLAGLMCTIHCNEGYGFANDPETLYYCTPKGKWHNAYANKGEKKPALPDCSKIRKPKEAIVNGEYHYLTDKCGGKQMNERIASNFIKLFKNTIFGLAGGCHGNRDCKIENVKVQCGERTRRMRRTSEDKQTATVSLVVSFVLKLPLISYRNASRDLNQTSRQISNDIQGALDKVDMTLNVSGAVVRTDRSKPPQVHLSRLVCGEGQVQSGATCVNCPLGHFFNGTSCKACAVDRYQDQEAQNSCLPCPSWTSTFGKQASKRLQDCLVNCPLGYFFNGTSCKACAVDRYQDQEAQNSCIPCPSGTSTFGQQASKRLQDCLECKDDPAYAPECQKMANFEGWCTYHEWLTREKCAKSCGWC